MFLEYSYGRELSENKSDIILIESFNSLDWLHTFNLAFNYLTNSINCFQLDQHVFPPKLPSLIKLITFVINFCFNLVLMFVFL